MNLKTKVKSYNFWVSLASALFLLIDLIGKQFGFSIDEASYYDIFTSLCGILVLFGIITLPAGSKTITKLEEITNENSADVGNKNEEPVEPVETDIEPTDKSAVTRTDASDNTSTIENATIEIESKNEEVIADNLSNENVNENNSNINQMIYFEPQSTETNTTSSCEVCSTVSAEVCNTNESDIQNN